MSEPWTQKEVDEMFPTERPVTNVAEPMLDELCLREEMTHGGWTLLKEEKPKPGQWVKVRTMQGAIFKALYTDSFKPWVLFGQCRVAAIVEWRRSQSLLRRPYRRLTEEDIRKRNKQQSTWCSRCKSGWHAACGGKRSGGLDNPGWLPCECGRGCHIARKP